MATIRDVAKMAGVSIATVSYVLNGSAPIGEETKKRVREAISALDYRPNVSARNLAASKVKSIAAFIAQGEDPFFIDTIKNIEKETIRRGYSLWICNLELDQTGGDYYVDAVVGNRMSGVFVLTELNEAQWKVLDSNDIPVIALNQTAFGQKSASIYLGSAAGIDQAVDHLVKLGHTRIGFVRCIENPTCKQPRLVAFQHSMAVRGLNVPAEYIVDGWLEKVQGRKNKSGRGNSNAEILDQGSRYAPLDGGHYAMRKLLMLDERPTAVICSNDLLAIGAQRAALEHGLRVPEDMSIIGYDDIAIAAYNNPALTTIRVSRSEIGETAAKMLFDRIDEEKVNFTEAVIETKLIVRNSTCPPSESGKTGDNAVSF